MNLLTGASLLALAKSIYYKYWLRGLAVILQKCRSMGLPERNMGPTPEEYGSTREEYCKN